MHRLIRSITIVSTVALSSSAALAAQSLAARVVAVHEGYVELEAEQPLPAWAAQGSPVQALGWQTQVQRVDGDRLTIALSRSRASRVQLDSEVVIREIPQQQRLGC